MINNYRTIIALLSVTLVYGHVLSMEKPVGKKREKTAWLERTHPETETMKKQLEITNIDELNLLRAIEKQDIDGIKKNASLLNLRTIYTPFTFTKELIKDAKMMGKKQKANKYAEILDLLQKLKAQQ